MNDMTFASAAPFLTGRRRPPGAGTHEAMTDWARRISALERAGDEDAADMAVRAAAQTLPHFALDYGRRAARQSRWEEATARWRQGLARFPDEPRLHTAFAEGLAATRRQDEAEAHLAATLPRFGGNSELLSRYAMLAERPGRWDEAIRRWRQVVALAPEDVGAIVRLGHCLRQAGRADEALDHVAAAEARLPRHPVLGQHLALWAEPDWDIAIPAWRRLRAAFPDYLHAWTGLASALTRSGDPAAAETVLTAALKPFPTDHRVLFARAQLAADRKDWQEAIARWRRLAVVVPHDANGVVRLGICLREAGRPEEAFQQLLQAEARLPPHPMLSQHLALWTEPDWDRAIPRWQRMVDQFPENVHAHLGLARAQDRAGDPLAAERHISTVRGQFPEDVRIAFLSAQLATDRQDWEAAVSRWERVLELDPDSAPGQRSLRAAREGLRLDLMLAAMPTEERTKPRPKARSAEETPHAALFMGFESLGQSCEFGLVQRHFGIEPLGLMRFAGMYPHKLVEALLNRFGGVGEAQYTTVTANRREYWTGDTRYGLPAHTFVNPHSISAEAFLPKQCRRLAFLRDKLVDDLVAAQKIFVFLAYANPSETMARTLHAAIRTYGPTQLLFVRAGIAGQAPGTVERVADGLMLGYLDHYGNLGETWDIAYDSWLAVCSKARDLVVVPAP